MIGECDAVVGDCMGKLAIELWEKDVLDKTVPLFDGLDLVLSERLQESILERPVHALNPAFGLRGGGVDAASADIGHREAVISLFCWIVSLSAVVIHGTVIRVHLLGNTKALNVIDPECEHGVG